MKNQLFLITGVMASGKSTVAQLLAERLEKSVHLRGDIFRKMIVSGREDMSEDPSEEAVSQLHLRYRLTAETALAYFDQGFSVVIQDNYYGEDLNYMMNLLKGYPVQLVVLCPSPEVVKRGKKAAKRQGTAGFLWNSSVMHFAGRPPRIGFWIDNSLQTPQETVEEILECLKDSVVGAHRSSHGRRKRSQEGKADGIF